MGFPGHGVGRAGADERPHHAARGTAADAQHQATGRTDPAQESRAHPPGSVPSVTGRRNRWRLVEHLAR